MQDISHKNSLAVGSEDSFVKLPDKSSIVQMMSNGQKPTNFNDISGMYEEVVDQKDCKSKAHLFMSYFLLIVRGGNDQ